jgi:regulator of sigma E protease
LGGSQLRVAIDQFSIGFGRAIARWTDRRGVEWRIGWIPLGGYVSFAGDASATSIPDRETLDPAPRPCAGGGSAGAEQRYFHFKPVWQKAIVVAAGPDRQLPAVDRHLLRSPRHLGEVRSPPVVSTVQANSPAERAGFQAGDVIVSAQNRRIENFTDVERIVILRAGEPIPFVVERGGRRVALVGTPERRVERDPISKPSRRWGGWAWKGPRARSRAAIACLPASCRGRGSGDMAGPGNLPDLPRPGS